MKNRWLVCPQPNSSATVRLFLFPYAGGAPSSFNKWASEFPNHIEVNTVHYPGRGSRYNEPLIKELSVLVEEIKNAIQTELDKPFFFFGHSLGAVLAFELARRINPQPQILFVSACGAPHVPNPNRPIHNLPDSEFIKSLQDLNGLPAEVSNNAELMELLLPTLRADFEAIENYQYTSNEHQLKCPVIAFGGVEDTHVSSQHLEAWRQLTSGSFKSQYFSGDHFFINAARQSLIASMISEIRS
ncbi:MAG: thioesterase domain-containing protein [Anaerolineales bacterium]